VNLCISSVHRQLRQLLSTFVNFCQLYRLSCTLAPLHLLQQTLSRPLRSYSRVGTEASCDRVPHSRPITPISTRSWTPATNDPLLESASVEIPLAFQLLLEYLQSAPDASMTAFLHSKHYNNLYNNLINTPLRLP